MIVTTFLSTYMFINVCSKLVLIIFIHKMQKTRQTLNAKISQLNSAIDNVSSRLRGGKTTPPVPLETDPEEAAM